LRNPESFEIGVHLLETGAHNLVRIEQIAIVTRFVRRLRAARPELDGVALSIHA
jgi:hypothetical protein